jgi:2-polyprenyl-3-methyl-5-hydroxy-6-metoxy-1,4-benzoquinol methylase
VNEIICPVCGHSVSGMEMVCTDFFVSGDKFPILKCAACGFRITGSAPDAVSIGRYYQSEEYVSHSNTREGFTNRVYHMVRNIMLGRKHKLVVKSSGRLSGTLLDIGAGTGYFLQTMLGKGWEITGTEKSESARKFAAEKWGIQLLPEDGLGSLPENSFDAITLWHVMEHLHDLEKYWKKLAGLIHPEGRLIIALPNPASADAWHYREQWAAWDVPRHLWHFSPENIQQIAKKHGFILQSTFRMPFDAFYVSILSEKYKKSVFPVMKGLWIGTLSWFSSLLSIHKSSSLIYVFKVEIDRIKQVQLLTT